MDNTRTESDQVINYQMITFGVGGIGNAEAGKMLDWLENMRLQGALFDGGSICEQMSFYLFRERDFRQARQRPS